jgi:thiol-disulfide isomerase/thioredoxin
MTKKISLLAFSLLFSIALFSQYDTTAPYLKTKLMPAFTVLSLDSVPFTQTVLSQGKSSLIMLFNPDCEHCQHQMQLLLTIPELTQNTNVILSSTETLPKIKSFYDKFHLEKYPLIRIGKDYKYFFGGFFQPKTIPVLAFYNKQNQLVYFNQGNVKKNTILQALKK